MDRMEAADGTASVSARVSEAGWANSERGVRERRGFPQTINKWENGQSSPTINDLMKLAKAYGIPPASFFMAPNKPKKDDASSDAIRVLAAVAGIHPCAFLWIDGDFSRLDEAEELTRMINAFERLPTELRRHWLTIGETYPLDD